jgi:hypothetical protein
MRVRRTTTVDAAGLVNVEYEILEISGAEQAGLDAADDKASYIEAHISPLGVIDVRPGYEHPSHRPIDPFDGKQVFVDGRTPTDNLALEAALAETDEL